ncbi:MAG: YcxB family protein [Asgard group archaeon]|nr:YcxB family protein [Asgard group archaeon]
MNENNKLTISYNVEFSDIKRIYIENYYTNVIYLALTILSALGLLSSIALLLNIYFTSTFGTYQIVFIISVMAIFTIFILRPIISIPRIKSIWYSSSKIPKNYNLVLSKNNITYNRSFGQMVYPWDILYQIVEQKSAFCFYLSSQEYFIIPKRVLNDEQIILLREIILASTNPQLLNVKLRNK